MNRRKRIAIGIVSVAALAAGAGGVAMATGDDSENDRPITGDALQRASAAALEHVGGGRVTETEVGDEESHYEVEVTRTDDSQVDVQLDREFRVVGDEAESGAEDDR